MQIRVVMLPANSPVAFKSGDRIVGRTSAAQGVIESIDIAPGMETFLTTSMMTKAQFQIGETVQTADGRSANVTAIGIPGV